MLAPLSWLKEYVDISTNVDNLSMRLTEVGLGVEKIEQKGTDKILELEVTPNRPDWLSMIGVAREIAVIEGEKVKYPVLKTDLTEKPKQVLPLEIKTDAEINPRFTAIIIDGIKVGPSPKWLKDYLEKIGQRSINNIVDITNFVMLETGNPLHAFDYNKISGHYMEVLQAKGGEEFKSVDGTSYHLPKGAVIIKDKKTIIDLCGIKGGQNSGTYDDTTTIVLRVPVEVPILIRQASQALNLRSDASSIFEKGVNKGGTINALNRAVDLILEIAGGQIASPLYDIKKHDFKPWNLKTPIEKLNSLTGITIPEKKILSILTSLDLSPEIKNDEIITTIPTFRNDLQIPVDIIEEIARIYGYNNFPQTLPNGEIPQKNIPYKKEYLLDEKIKNILKASGFSEIYTYSLVSNSDLESIGIKPEKTLRVDNPVSKEYEYLRPALKIGLLKGLKQNKSEEKINLFELGKTYIGKSLDEVKEEYYLSGVSNSKSYHKIKGILEVIFKDLGIKKDVTSYIHLIPQGIYFEINYSNLLNEEKKSKKYIPIPKYPPIIEDISIVAPSNIRTGQLIKEIKNQSDIIDDVSLLDEYENSRTFHIIYLDRRKNLTNDEVKIIREKILKTLKEKYNAKQKD